MIYIFIFILLFLLGVRYDISERKKNIDRWFNIVSLILILTSGLRYRIGGDSIAYLYSYFYIVPQIDELSLDTIAISQYEPFVLLLLSSLKSLGVGFYVFQLIHSSFVNGLILLYMKKHSKYPFFCALFYFVWMYFLFNFEIIRASFAIAICLWANDAIIENKKLRGICLYLCAIMFHVSAICLLFFPLAKRLRFNYAGFIFLLGVFLFGFIFASWFSNYTFNLESFSTTSEKLNLYSESADVGYSFMGFILALVPSLFYPFVSLLQIKKKKDCTNLSLLKMEPILVYGALFRLMSFSLTIVYRIVYFFNVYNIMYSVDLFVEMIKKQKRKVDPIMALAWSFIFFLPLFNLYTTYYRGVPDIKERNKVYNYKKYYPYSSVLDKSLDSQRERMWGYPYPSSPNEY